MTNKHSEANDQVKAASAPSSESDSVVSHDKLSNILWCLRHTIRTDGQCLDSAARDDHKFLAFDAQHCARFWRMNQASSVLDNTTVFLDYLYKIQKNPSLLSQAARRHGFKDVIDFEKYVANIEHLMLCLQQAALNIIVRSSLDAFEAEVNDWNRWYRQTQSSCKDWFSEWSSDRPPLNSTMPWNIKASLVVLWGVCWMFYADWYAQTPASPYTTEPIVDGQVVGSSNTRSTTTPPSIAHLSSIQPFFSHDNIDQSEQFGPFDSGRNLIGYNSPAVPQSPIPSHMLRRSSGVADLYQAAMISTTTTQQTSDAGFHTPLTTAVSTPTTRRPSAPSTVFATPATINWTPPPENNKNTSAAGLNSHSYSHQQQYRLQPDLRQNVSLSPFSSPANYHLPNNFSTTSTSTAPVDWVTGLGLGPPIYHTDSHILTGFVTYPEAMPQGHGRPGPQSPVQDAISAPETSPGSVGSENPPKDTDGNYVCTYADCQVTPRIFARRCEWKKHMERHTRPYICNEIGCEKLQGFTYSGGLLRHKREVHNAHGGPRQPRFCPHATCKRHTGTGFTRKENLNEHLRRVHNSGGIEGSNVVTKHESSISPGMPNMILPSQRHESLEPLNDRKRPRGDSVSDEIERQLPQRPDLEQRINNLRNEIQRLRQELQDKDNQIAQKDAQITQRDNYIVQLQQQL